MMKEISIRKINNGYLATTYYGGQETLINYFPTLRDSFKHYESTLVQIEKDVEEKNKKQVRVED